MTRKILLPLLALAILLVFASAVQSPPPRTRPGPWRPGSWRREHAKPPARVATQREELLRLRRELVGRRILREVGEKLPQGKKLEIMRQFNIRPDVELRKLTDGQIFRTMQQILEQMQGYTEYDYANAPVKDVCAGVPGIEPGGVLALTCVEDPAIIKASRSVAAIVKKEYLIEEVPGGGRWKLKTWPLTMVDTVSVDLCGTEPIRNSPCTWVVGTCFLVAGDVVATAGHVVYGEDFLKNVYFLFDYTMQSDGDPKTVFDDSEVYEGAEVLAKETGDADWALIRLAGQVTGRDPLPYRKKDKVPDNTSVYMLGHPEGMPLKYVGETVISWNSLCPYFLAPLDARPSNSGSPVFNATTHEVEGIMVRDKPTYETMCECVVTSVHSETYGYEGANVVRTTEFVGALEYPDLVLVRSQLRQGEYALIDAGGTVYTFNPGEEKFLPYDYLGLVLVTNTDCSVTYHADRGSVWDIISTSSGAYRTMSEACFR